MEARLVCLLSVEHSLEEIHRSKIFSAQSRWFMEIAHASIMKCVSRKLIFSPGYYCICTGHINAVLPVNRVIVGLEVESVEY